MYMRSQKMYLSWAGLPSICLILLVVRLVHFPLLQLCQGYGRVFEIRVVEEVRHFCELALLLAHVSLCCSLR